MTTWFAVPHTGPVVWLVVESNNFFYVSLGHPTTSSQCTPHMWEHSKDFTTYNIYSWAFIIPCSMVPALFVGFYITLLFFSPFIVIVEYVNSIQFPFYLVVGAPITTLAISCNLILWFLESLGFNIFMSLSITIFGVPYFSVGAGLGYVTSSSLNCCKDRSFVFL